MRILVIEDDPETSVYIATGLREVGHAVDCSGNGSEGLLMAGGNSYDVIVVDRMLPGVDGLRLVKTIRAAGIETPGLFLTTLGGLDDRVDGLNAGGDDYLGKPFAFSELAARVAALGRRPRSAGQQTPTSLVVGDLELSLLSRSVRRGGKEIDLLPREFQLLEYLMRHAGQVVTRTMLLERVWDFHFDPQTTVVETHMSRLRAKIDKDFERPLLHTVRGAGYCLRAAD